jgi:glycosyltransferase involved in cell wall biosynthesis
VSIVIASFNKAKLLDNTLASIRRNITDLPYELIVVDDGSADKTFEICKKHQCKYAWLDSPLYRNPSVPRNVAAKMARGKILIMQSDDVIHMQTDTIDRLADLQRGEVKFATVYSQDVHGNRLQPYVGKECPRPFFFLGSIYRDDFWAIGGNDEDFTSPGYEDDWLGEQVKRHYKIEFCDEVVAHHQMHGRPRNLGRLVHPSRVLFEEKKKELE